MSFDLADVLKGVSNLDTGRDQIEYIPLDKIDGDPNNFYSMRGIDELAANIAMCGLQQPIRVRQKEDGRYVTVSGHRRREALLLLAEKEPDRWREAPCIVEHDNASPALQQLRLIYANANTRAMTSAELSEQAERVEKLLYQLQEEGYQFPGRMRDHVAQAVGASKSKLSRLKVIREKLIPSLAEMWKSGKLGESLAYALAVLDADRQRMFLDTNPDSLHCLYAGSVEVRNRVMDDAERSCEKLKCRDGRRCYHGDMRQREIARNGYVNCTGCCLSCRYLIDCQYSCPTADGKRKKLRNERKENRKEEKAAEEKKEAPEKEMFARAYDRIGRLRQERGVSASDFVRVSSGYEFSSDVKRLEALETGEKQKPADRMPGRILPSEAKRLIDTADLLGCSVDYLLGRENPANDKVPNLGTIPIENIVNNNAVPDLGTWHRGAPPEQGKYAVLFRDCDGDLVADVDSYTADGWDCYDDAVMWTCLPQDLDGGED